MSEAFGFTPRLSVSDAERAEFLAFAEATVVRAGAATLPFFRAGVSVDNKREEGFDPVTQADRAAEQVIREALAERYPGHGVLGEEYGYQSGNGLTWVIDPVDGTRAFLSGMLHWGVLLGLFDGEDAVVGAMYQPYVGELFSGDGTSAWCTRNGERQPLRSSQRQTLADAIIACTGTEYFRGDDLTRFNLLQENTRMCRLGTDCYAYAMVAAGAVDFGTDARLNPYDIEALIPIIRGAGGVVTTYDGGTPVLGGTVLASGNETLHRAALALFESGG